MAKTTYNTTDVGGKFAALVRWHDNRGEVVYTYEISRQADQHARTHAAYLNMIERGETVTSDQRAVVDRFRR